MKIISAESLIRHDTMGKAVPMFIMIVEEDDGTRKTYYNSAAARFLNGKTLL